jgi:hypothetical protein
MSSIPFTRGKNPCGNRTQHLWGNSRFTTAPFKLLFRSPLNRKFGKPKKDKIRKDGGCYIERFYIILARKRKAMFGYWTLFEQFKN